MPVSIVIGGQYGSEGKGKVALYLAKEMEATYVVRCGGPNSGHTVIDAFGKIRIFQQLPTAAILESPKLAICAGSYIDLKILLKEIKETNVGHDRLVIDPDAVLITDELKDRDTRSGLIEDIGSTGSGTGAAVAARVNREKEITFARNCKQLEPYIGSVSRRLRTALFNGERVVIEGTQGFGLSPLHARHYPFCTSRDTTAAAFLAETGLSPFDVDDIVMVIRAFPIRVDGNSGPLDNEITWESITKACGRQTPIKERTSVSRKVRRVANFSAHIVKQAIEVNQPTRIVINHLDYLPSSSIDKFLRDTEYSLGRKIDLLGFSASNLSDNVRTHKMKLI